MHSVQGAVLRAWWRVFRMRTRDAMRGLRADHSRCPSETWVLAHRRILARCPQMPLRRHLVSRRRHKSLDVSTQQPVLRRKPRRAPMLSVRGWFFLKLDRRWEMPSLCVWGTPRANDRPLHRRGSVCYDRPRLRLQESSKKGQRKRQGYRSAKPTTLKS